MWFRQCNVMPTYWIRQAQHAHASNSDTLKKSKKRKINKRKWSAVWNPGILGSTGSFQSTEPRNTARTRSMTKIEPWSTASTRITYWYSPSKNNALYFSPLVYLEHLCTFFYRVKYVRTPVLHHRMHYRRKTSTNLICGATACSANHSSSNCVAVQLTGPDGK